MNLDSLHSKLFRLVPALFPLVILVVTGFRGLDFGNHWDERGYQLAPIKTILHRRAPLPGHYGYPSLDYWVSTAALLPEIVTLWNEKTDRFEKLAAVIGSQRYLLRVRGIFLTVTSLSVLWVYLVVLSWRGSWPEALSAACFLAFSWEVAYHLRWIATDGMLMQFGALTLLFAMVSSLKPRGSYWIYFGAVIAGLGLGTKYPGGLAFIPILLAGYLQNRDGQVKRLVLHLGTLSSLFFITFLISTPAVLLRPAEVWTGILYEIQHYASGHAGHTVPAGLRHGGRMLIYLSTVLFSPLPVVALSVFGLALIGGIALIREERKLATLFLSFPLVYFFYFCMQKAMIVRNLLVLAPFLAVLAARGAGTIWKWTQTASWPNRGTLRLIRAALVTGIALAACMNACWLFYAAETIANRTSDRFAVEALRQIEREPERLFFLSPLVNTHFKQVVQNLPANVTTDRSKAERVLLYASEALKDWRYWPANRPTLTERWFGPYEVNFNIYPNWWGDDRIIEITRSRANELRILVCCKASSAQKLDIGELPDYAQIAKSAPKETSFAIPDLDPCALVLRAEAEAIMGPLVEGPHPGGSAADGTACAYTGKRPIVATIGVISTRSFEDRRSEAGNSPVSGSVHEMFVAQTNSFRDVRLLARLGGIALMINVAAWEIQDRERINIATRLATTALGRFGEATP
jgi:hypothetical protein